VDAGYAPAVARGAHHRRIGRLALVLAAGWLVAAPSAAMAGPVEAILDDAEDGHVDGTYSRQDLRRASRVVSVDRAQYSDISDVIRDAYLDQLYGVAPAGGASGRTPGYAGLVAAEPAGDGASAVPAVVYVLLGAGVATGGAALVLRRREKQD
jgi:hypothetical protein